MKRNFEFPIRAPLRLGVVILSLTAIILCSSGVTSAQTINIDRVVAELEPEIHRALLA
jgi:hypothetical protein